MNTDNWISVNDRLPEIDGEYIVSNGSMVGVAYYENIGIEYQFHREDYDSFYHNDVTHWQPLPKPPKEKIQSL
jgi:hypothetical protein